MKQRKGFFLELNLNVNYSRIGGINKTFAVKKRQKKEWLKKIIKAKPK